MFSIKASLFFLLISFNIFSQKLAPIEFGKVPMEDLQMKIYAKDSSAEAVVLCDYGEYFYTFPYNHPKVNYYRHIRIKILKKSGFGRAKIRIPYYPSNDDRTERVSNIKAITHNLEGEKPVEYPVDANSIFINKVSKDVHYQMFTLPQVREGSVIEYSYELESGRWYSLQPWVFQQSIPVVWSELRAMIPYYFGYKLILQSYVDLDVNEIDEGEDNYLRRNFRDKHLTYRVAMKDIPSLKEESFITSIENFRWKLDFELTATYFPNQPKKDYSKTWESLCSTLLEDDSFGKQIKKFDYANDIAKTLKTQYKDSLSLATAAFKYIQKTMLWNGEESIGASSNLDKIYEKRTGNVTEINLMLVRLLRECGFEANPFILSTRENGDVKDLVLAERFNYTIAHIVLGGKDILLDATSSLTPFGMLPVRCMNERGRLIVRKNSRWININTEPIRRKITTNTMTILSGQEIKGISQVSYAGHNALELRTMVKNKGKEGYLSDYKKNRPNQTIESIKTSNLDTLERNVELEVKTTLNEAYTVTGDHIYFMPMLLEAQRSNPFKLTERRYPIDFGVPQEEIYTATFSLPKGYVVEEMPKQDAELLPNDGGEFRYSCIVENNTLKIISKITLKKAIYLRDEYLTLQDFYNRVVSKHAEQVVLKKK
jgi:Domain of Unknown Function with PDB structure (DUF3857)